MHYFFRLMSGNYAAGRITNTKKNSQLGDKMRHSSTISLGRETVRTIKDRDGNKKSGCKISNIIRRKSDDSSQERFHDQNGVLAFYLD